MAKDKAEMLASAQFNVLFIVVIRRLKPTAKGKAEMLYQCLSIAVHFSERIYGFINNNLSG